MTLQQGHVVPSQLLEMKPVDPTRCDQTAKPALNIASACLQCLQSCVEHPVMDHDCSTHILLSLFW